MYALSLFNHQISLQAHEGVLLHLSKLRLREERYLPKKERWSLDPVGADFRAQD